jgi:hypothetical protein
MKYLSPRLFGLCLITALLASAAMAQGKYGGSYARGIELFYQKDYAGATAEFEKAEVETPGNHAAYLWHGIAFTALGDLDTRAANIWLKMPWDTKAKTLYRYFMGLGYWQQGNTSQAKYWFNENSNYKDTPAYQLSQTALRSMLNDGDAPPIESWPTLGSLPGARGNRASAGGASDRQEKEASSSASTGAKPSAGTWRGTISNGYTGQKIAFRVAADGRTISAITFEGYIRCPKAMNPTQSTRLAPPGPVAVNGGAFSSTQSDAPSRTWFKFEGTINAATSASGTLRIATGGGECDTYELKWAASRVGP